MSQVKWKKILGYEHYEVSSIGEVRNENKQVLKFRVHRGYRSVYLYKNQTRKKFAIASLVLATFKTPRPTGMQCAHLDGNRTNNSINNLAWVTPKENTSHKRLHGTTQEGEKHGRAKLTAKQILEIRRRYKRTAHSRSNVVELAKEFGVNRATIIDIKSKIRWGHV